MAAVIHGTISFRSGESGVAGYTVVAFDQDIGGEDRLGTAITDANGHYRIDYTEAKFRHSPSERGGADVFVRLYDRKGKLLHETNTIRNAPIEVVLDVEVPDRVFVVRGKVRLLDGTPAAGATVRAHVRRAEPLGTAVITDPDGNYEIRYVASDFARAEKGHADLQVTAQVEGREAVSNEILFNAPADASVDLAL